MDYHNVYAKETTFYEAEYVDNMYLIRYNPKDKMKYYQKAQVFRESNTNEIAYCLEPFETINEQSVYNSTDIPYNLTEQQVEKISKIAYFGYGYKNHTDIKWYPITQLLIWKEADPSGDYYFTNGLNGPRTNIYDRELQEILNYIEWYDEIPEFNDNTYTIVEGERLILEDNNNLLKNYKTDDSRLNIIENVIEVDSLTEGKYDFTIYKEETYYNKPYIFYYSYNSQNLLETGNLKNKEFKFHINVLHTVLELIKIDKDNMSSTPSGEGVLEGAKFAIMDQNYYQFMEWELNGSFNYIENLPLGKYYIKEISPGEGYTLNEEIYEFEFNEENYFSSITVENEIIKKNITINKLYGSDNNWNYEEDIEFAIYDKNNNQVRKIKTNKEGIATTNIPYGTYTISQINSKEGYEKVNDFTITIENTEDETIQLKDLKIPVPNTHTTENKIEIQVPNTKSYDIFQIIIEFIKFILR